MQPDIAHKNGRGVWLYKWRFATASQISSQRPFFADAGIRHWNASSSRIRTSRSDELADSVIPCSHPALIQRASLKEQISRRCCKCAPSLWDVQVSLACWWHSRWVCVMLGKIPCWCCAQWDWLLSLLEFQPCLSALIDSFLFRERLCPSGPVRKKQWGRGFEQPVTSELTPAQYPRASPSPHREHLPVFFTQHGQHPSAAASDMISFGVSDNKLDDSLSLAASDAEELSGSMTDPALLPSSASRNARLRADEELICIMTKAVNELELELPPPEEPSRSRLDKWFLPGHHQALRQCSSPFFPKVHDELMKSWRAPCQMRFAFEGVAYQYKVLPFGLSLAPRTFTRCMDAALSPLRQMGICMLNYLGDWLILAQSQAVLT